jgi:predicted nucleotidyltransferase
VNFSATGIDPSALQSAANHLGSLEGIDAAYLMGSAATHRLRAESDVDIAILPKRSAVVSGNFRADLAAELESIFGRSVDVGILHTGNLVYAKEAVTRGILLFERKPGAKARFEMLTLSMYADLQENRREILHAYAA